MFVLTRWMSRPKRRRDTYESFMSRQKEQNVTGDCLDLFETMFAPSDGNCLYHCFKFAIIDAFPDFEPSVNWIRILRKVVAKRLTLDEFETAKEVYEMAKKHRDLQTMHELRMMNGIDTMSAFRQMFLNQNQWGNEQTLNHLRNFTGIQPVILRSSSNGQTLTFSMGYSDSDGHVFEGRSSRMFVFFHLQSGHYNLLRYNDKIILDLETTEMVTDLLTRKINAWSTGEVPRGSIEACSVLPELDGDGQPVRSLYLPFL